VIEINTRSAFNKIIFNFKNNVECITPISVGIKREYLWYIEAGESKTKCSIVTVNGVVRVSESLVQLEEIASTALNSENDDIAEEVYNLVKDFIGREFELNVLVSMQGESKEGWKKEETYFCDSFDEIQIEDDGNGAGKVNVFGLVAGKSPNESISVSLNNTPISVKSLIKYGVHI
jgi:hypothetical protein